MPWLSHEAIMSAVDAFNRAIVKFAHKHENVYVDTLHAAIPGDDEHFADSVHFTDKGAAVMAKRVVDALVREGLIDKATAFLHSGRAMVE